jgi:hypothetical protein
MSDVFTSAGTTISIGAALPATFTKAGYEAVTWTAIGEIVDAGEFGRIYNSVSHNPLGDRRTIKRKGSYNDGTITLQLGRDTSDAGQIALIAALASDDSYSIRVVLQDTAHLYTTAQVMSYTTNIGSVDQITGATVTLEIDYDILETTAPA